MSWLRLEENDEVWRLVIDRPDRKNAIPFDGWPELGEAFRRFEASSARVLIITGAGGEFCAGADLDPSRVDLLSTQAARHRRMKEVGDVAMTLHRLSKPTIAAVDGVAVGAGMNLALGCDVVVATTRARFSEIFVRRGLTLDFGGTWLLPRVVGLQRAKELALTGRIVEADEALAIGLALEIVDPQRLEERVMEVAQAILLGAPLAQGFVKQALDSSFESSFAESVTWEGQSQSILLGTEDATEGMAAFVEKRAPSWKGR
ncbi:MAG: enoyl-CoA hydratase/isomerase family protein [Actinobacteria bacterium]|nr:enoyl-CoA hydratase/isomerase family protein [Actinomycetota bacterium]MCI0543431.1 enoyl-CoA hydratase/isomerase family protein [Actinomycetota bacterium]